MAKYYVCCGKVKKVLDRESRERAAFDAVEGEIRPDKGRFDSAADLMHLGLITSVSERGFKDHEALYYLTHLIMFCLDDFGRFVRETREPGS